MGYDFGKGFTKQDAVKEAAETSNLCDIGLDGPWQNWKASGNTRARTIKKAVCKDTAWLVIAKEVREKVGAKWVEVSRSINCIMLVEQEGFGWGYKRIDSRDGPCAYDCPLSYLAMVPCGDGVSEINWREKVVRWHKENGKLQFQEGDFLLFDKPIRWESGLEVAMFQCYNKKKHLFYAFIDSRRLNQYFSLPPASLKGRACTITTPPENDDN